MACKNHLLILSGIYLFYGIVSIVCSTSVRDLGFIKDNYGELIAYENDEKISRHRDISFRGVTEFFNKSCTLWNSVPGITGILFSLQYMCDVLNYDPRIQYYNTYLITEISIFVILALFIIDISRKLGYSCWINSAYFVCLISLCSTASAVLLTQSG